MKFFLDENFPKSSEVILNLFAPKNGFDNHTGRN